MDVKNPVSGSIFLEKSADFGQKSGFLCKSYIYWLRWKFFSDRLVDGDRPCYNFAEAQFGM